VASDTKMKHPFKKYFPLYKSNFLLAYPVVISQLGHMFTAVLDSVMVGHLGIVPLAACALGNSIFAICLVIGIGISQGITPLVAQENGKNNKKLCGQYLEQGVFISLITGIILFAILLLVAQRIDLLNQPVAVAVAAKDFLILLAASIIPLMVFQSFRQFAEGLSYTKQAMYISVAGNVSNILFNFVFIYGWFGFSPMGIVGAGLGTLLARVLMAVGMGIFVLRSTLFHPYLANFKIHLPNWKKIKSILQLGFPIAMQYFFEVGAFSGAAIMIGWIGAKELAAHQIAINLAALTYMGASGIGVAATIKAGNALGKKDFKELKLSAVSSYHLVILYMCITALIFITCNTILPYLYIKDVSVVIIASQLLIMAAFFQISDGVQVVGAGILRGLSDVKIPTFITLIAYWVIGLPLGYVLCFTFNFGPIGIWIALSLALTAAAIALFFRSMRSIKKLNHQLV
jgi:multidrug resistance protein, MATE family